MRYFLECSYRGTAYHGWQIQPNALSVQEVIHSSLSTILRERIEVVGAGRTDTGVHAEQMFAHFDFDGHLEGEELSYKLNSLLPPDIAAHRIIRVADDAHARFDASRRSYRYEITFAKNPFKTDLALQFNREVDVEQMSIAANSLLKYKDFGAFARSHGQAHTNICTLYEVRWEQRADGLAFHISANRFLRNMVRAIVGTLLDVGRQKLTTEQFEHIIQSGDRRMASESAAAHGLYLTEVYYPEKITHVAG